jgi:hypothetical protein
MGGEGGMGGPGMGGQGMPNMGSAGMPGGGFGGTGMPLGGGKPIGPDVAGMSQGLPGRASITSGGMGAMSGPQMRALAPAVRHAVAEWADRPPPAGGMGRLPGNPGMPLPGSLRRGRSSRRCIELVRCSMPSGRPPQQ